MGYTNYNRFAWQSQMLIEHWNGSSWDSFFSPSPGGFSGLKAVSAASATDAWAVGLTNAGGTGTPLALHWDGRGWVSIPTPALPRDSEPESVTDISPTNAWAVDFTTNADGTFTTLLEHWDGSQWLIVPSPSPATGFPDSEFTSVTVDSATDAWAVGFYADSTGAHTIAEHLTGGQWTDTPPSLPGTEGMLSSVAATSATDALLVGVTDESGIDLPLAEHWDGNFRTASSIAATPASSFLGVAATSAGNAWAVGGTSIPVGAAGAEATVIQRWDGSSWVPVPSF